MTKKKENPKRALHFIEGNEFEWIASILDNFADNTEANLPSYVSDPAEYHSMEGSIAWIRELTAKIATKQLRKKMTTDEWECVCMYLHQELSD